MVGSTAPSEQGHYYHPSGDTAYEVPYADPRKGMRNTTLGDAKKLGLLPSVTTITKILDKPGLNNWRVTQAVLAAEKLPRLEGESDESWVARVNVLSKNEGKKATDRGTALHGDIELAIQGKPHGHKPHIEALEREFEALGLNLYEGMTERSFGCKLGYGGKIDWSNPLAICDFKSKQFIKPGNLAWDEHVVQLSSYAFGMDIFNPRCINFFVGIDDCKVVPHEWKPDKIEWGMDYFRILLSAWYHKNQITRPTF